MEDVYNNPDVIYNDYSTQAALPVFEATQGVGAAVVTIAGASGPNVAFGGTTGLTFTGAGSTITVAGTLATANGGTNQTAWTAGSIPYLSNATTFAQDNANHFWDGTNHRLGIGTASPGRKLHVKGANDDQVIIDNDTSQFTSAYWYHNGAVRAQAAWDETNSNFIVGGAAAGAKLAFAYAAGSIGGSFGATGGLLLGAPTGGDKGLGTLNAATDLFKNGTAYTNPGWVFEHFFKGALEKYAGKFGAEDYKGLPSIDETKAICEKDLELPQMTRFKESGFFDRGDMLLASLEQAFLYIFELHERIRKLELANPPPREG